MQLRIYIPTLGRIEKQATWDRLPLNLRKNAVLVCPLEEEEEHKTRLRTVVPCSNKGIGTVRDFILNYAAAHGQKYVVMLDDDVVLQKRRPDMRITNAVSKEYSGAFEWIEETLSKGVAHCGWGTRFLGYNAPGKQVSPGRMMYCLAYNVPMVMKAGASFMKGLPKWNSVMEDFNMTLQLLRAGLPNVISLTWRASPGPSNAAGGCSTYRTAQRQTESAHRLEKMYPGIVKVRPKKQWQGMEGPMYDVTVYWKKALTQGQSKITEKGVAR